MTALLLDGLERPPKHLHIPPHVGTYADEVADLAAAVGLPLDPEQRLLAEAATAYDEHGRTVATKVGCSAPRQNVKTHGGKALALADLALFAIPEALWSAHLRETSDDAFRSKYGNGLADLFDNYDFLRRMVARNGIVDSDNEKSITLRPAKAGDPSPSLTFRTRSERGGRGLSGRRVTYDEALFLKPSMTSAMIPILSAQSMTGQVQVRYLGSPGLLMSQVWREVRDRGRAGSDPTLAWLEWYATVRPCGLGGDCTHAVGMPDCYLDDPALIREANLAVDRRIDIRFVLQTERTDMTPQDYARERMGQWEDPPNTEGGDLDLDQWNRLVDLEVKRGTQVVFGVDVGEDRTADIAVVWRRPDDHVQVMLAEPDEGQRRRVSAMTAAERIRQLATEYRGRVMLGGPAAVLEKDLTGLDVEVVGSGDFASACGQFADLLKAGEIHHQDQDELNKAVGGAKWRSVGTSGERAWRLKDAVGIGPLAAATRALAGLVLHPVTPPAAPRAVSTRTSGAATDGIADMTF